MDFEPRKREEWKKLLLSNNNEDRKVANTVAKAAAVHAGLSSVKGLSSPTEQKLDYIMAYQAAVCGETDGMSDDVDDEEVVEEPKKAGKTTKTSATAQAIRDKAKAKAKTRKVAPPKNPEDAEVKDAPEEKSEPAAAAVDFSALEDTITEKLSSAVEQIESMLAKDSDNIASLRKDVALLKEVVEIQQAFINEAHLILRSIVLAQSDVADMLSDEEIVGEIQGNSVVSGEPLAGGKAK